MRSETSFAFFSRVACGREGNGRREERLGREAGLPRGGLPRGRVLAIFTQRATTTRRPFHSQRIQVGLCHRLGGPICRETRNVDLRDARKTEPGGAIGLRVPIARARSTLTLPARAHTRNGLYT